MKKIGDNLYRARLDRSNRLLFALYRHKGERCALMLEYIHQHAYEKSRFLACGVRIDEDRIPSVDAGAADEAPELPYLNPKLPRFHLLDKVLSFDEDQETVYRQSPPLVIIGSAGSGKTWLLVTRILRLLMSGGEASLVQIIGRGFAAAAGGAWIVFAPFLGAVGSFFSGSATISNLTFGGIQASIADSLGLDRSTILALQSVGGAMGNMVCIHNIVAVCAVVMPS